MLRLFLPNEQVVTVHDIDFDQLKKQGIQGIITDLDNTLVAWDQAHATEEVKAWFKKLEEKDFKFIVMSNNDEDRVQIFCDPIEVDYVHKARKPLRRNFLKVARQMNLQPEQIAVIGDQLLTDVLGGNLSRFYTILVRPIVETDAKITQFNRKIERRILNHFKKRGKIK